MTCFTHLPNQTLLTPTDLRPKSSNAALQSMSVLVGGGLVLLPPTLSGTSASTVTHVLPPTSNVAVSPDTTSCAAPMSLSVWVLPVFIYPVSIPIGMSSIESPIAASVEIYFSQRVEGDPAISYISDQVLPNV